MKKIKTTIQLNSEGIDQASAVLQDWMYGKNVQSRNLQLVRLAFETILLGLAEHYGEGQEATLILRQHLGVKSVSLCYEGEPYNPMSGSGMPDKGLTDDPDAGEPEKDARPSGGGSSDEWTERFLSDIMMKPHWKHAKGKNELYIRIPRNKLRDELQLLFALILAIILGFAGMYLPESVTGTTMEYVLEPIALIFMSLLKTLAGLLVFLSIVTGICGIGSLSDFSKVGKYMIGRYVLFTFLGAGFCVLAMLPLHSLVFGTAQGGSQVKRIFDLVLMIVPDNPITPFSECNLLQIVFLAILFGVAILVLLRESGELHAVLIQIKNAVMYLVSLLCRLIPIYIIASLTVLFWKHGMGIFASIWKPLVLVVIMLHLMAMVKVMSVSIRCKVSPGLLFKKAATSYITGLTTSSSMAALGTVLDASEHRFGVPKSLGEFGVPIGNVIGRQFVSGGFVIILFFLAEHAGVPIDISWLIGMWIYVSIISFAMVPVAGGTLICLGVMLAQFGIPAEYLGMAASLTLLSDFVMAGTYVLDEHMEMVLQARHWGTLDVETLRKPNAR